MRMILIDLGRVVNREFAIFVPDARAMPFPACQEGEIFAAL